MEGRKNIHNEERTGQPFVVNDDLVQSVDQKISERRRFTIFKLSCEFPQISRTCLLRDYDGYARLSQVLRKRIASALTLLE
jgi:hypothetical protein